MVKPVDYAALTERPCSKCGETKPVAEFNRYDDPTAVLTGWRYYSWCRPCSNDRARTYGTENRERRNKRLRAWRRANPEAAKVKDRDAKRARYGLTAESEAEAFAKHDGKCWLCRTRPAKVRDHDHKTGEFRGVLCHGCNSVTVARADADPGYLARVAAYLDQPCHADVLLELASEEAPDVR
jgi:hypothetical protein